MPDIITYGGGFGASKHDNNLWNASEGGSGGGGSGGRASSSSYGGLAANGFSGQGFAGSNSASTWYPGGGGGANAIGANNPANGGNGFYSTILGANGVYANGYWFGGGGGGAGYSARAGNGGLGGGGGGAPFVSDGGFGGLGGLNNGNNSTAGSLNSQTNVPGGNGGINTGGGGGGGSHYNSNNQGGSGGSGIVVFRYQIPNKPTAVQVNPANASITLNETTANPDYIPVSPIPGYGTAPYTYSVSPALPTGLSIGVANGAIIGQPTVAVTNQPYTVTVTDSLSQAANANFTLTTSLTYLYAIELNTASIDVTTYYGLPANNFTPAQIGGNTEIQIESYQAPTELLYSATPVANIPVMAGQTYGYTGQNLVVNELDPSFNNYLDLDDKLRTIYGCVNANVSGLFLSSQEYTAPGTYSWTVPNGVTSISVAAIGGGGGSSQKPSGGTGGGGAQLKYVNNVSVTPGQVYSIVVGNGGVTGGDFGTSGQFTTMTLVSNGNVVISAAGGAGGDALYWIANSSQANINDVSQTIFTFQAGISGGQTINYSISNGSLPTGTSLNSSTGALTWTEQGLVAAQTYPSFTVSASAANQIVNSPFTLTVNPRPDITYVAEGGYSNGAARTGTFTLSVLTTYIDVWGCGGGGTSTAEFTSLSGAGGGGGAASQLNGYRLSVTPGETLSYSIGSYGQSTTISRGATVIFTLNGGGNATSISGGSGGALTAFASHAGGGGGGGGPRFQNGGGGTSVTGCGGGGGGGGYCDNSPLCGGYPGGAGGNSATPAGSIVTGTTGGAGGTGGGSGANSRGGNVLMAQGGVVGGQLYNGSGGGAGAGIRINAISTTSYWGGGAGGAGSGAGGLVTPGGPGCLYVFWGG